MKKLFAKILIFFLICSNVQISYASNTPANASVLKIREIETRYFDINDEKTVLKAIVNTLQDNGFVIQNIEEELGYIRAKKEDKLKRTLKGRVAVYSVDMALNAVLLAFSFGLNPSAVINIANDTIRIKNEVSCHTVIFDCNVTVESVGNRTKVRFNVIEKVLENADGYTTVKASPRQVIRHYEPEIFNEFFSQVDKNLFFEKNSL